LLGAHASDSRSPPSALGLLPRSRERGAGTAVQPSSPFRPGASLTRVRGRSVLVLRLAPESQFAKTSSRLACHEMVSARGLDLPARGIAGRSTDYRPPAPRPGRSPDRNITALRGSRARAYQLHGSSCSAIRAAWSTFRLAADLRTLPRPSDFSRRRRPALPSSASRLRAHSHKERVRASAESSQVALHAEDPSCSRVGASERGIYLLRGCPNDAKNDGQDRY
jgi:hypothetical protein